jgi:hypothetical protein
MAGKGKKTFVAGEVLLAQDVNDYLMDQSVMNFASSAARSSAIPTPTEGMTTYVQDRNQIETFDGAEYRGMSGLQLVKKQAIGSAVSSVVVNDAFSATYENYKIIISDGLASAATNLNLTLGSTTTGYNAATIRIAFSGATSLNVGTVNGSNFGFGTGNTGYLHFDVNLINPFLTNNTFVNGPYFSITTGGFSTGYLANTTSYTAFTITSSVGTLTGGTIYVYGYGT